MLDKLIKDALPNLSEATLQKLLRQLEGVGKDLLVTETAKLTARGLVKGLDTFAAIAVANLPKEDAGQLIDHYVDLLIVQMDQMVEAVQEYAPLALAVEVAKQEHGNTSAEANAARREREKAMNELRQEVRDVLKAATGGDVAD